MNLPRYARVLLAIGSGVALGLSFPNYNLYLLAWIAMGMLVLASAGAPLKEAPLYGFLHGQVFYPVCLPWVDTVMRQYGNIDPWIAAGFVGLIGFIGGLICTIFSTGVALASKKSKLLACLLAPFLWTALEYFRTNVPIIGSSWDLSGYPAARSMALLQITSVTGIYGLCFLIATYGALVAYAVLANTRRVWGVAAIATLVLVVVSVGGAYLIPQSAPHYVAHLVQTNFPQSESYPSDWLQIHAGELDELERISVDAARSAAGIVIWPEVPAPFSFTEAPFAQRAERIAQEAGNYFLVGVLDWKQDPSGKWLAYNSAVLLNPEGQRVYSYNKIHLLPFGEYVPLRGWLTFAKRLTADISDFTPGSQYNIAQVPQGTFGTFICYEAIFPSEVRRFTAGGAQLLITISNDGWFGRSSAAEQHMAMARVRAVENRRWLLRDTNNGYTESIDPYGRTAAQFPLDIRGQLDAPYDFRSDMTLYARFGDWFSWLCVIVTIAILGLALKPRVSQPVLRAENPVR
ncbi:MAG TPA: apolipoprotein N-acyltransferase [Candidatus Acidoferrales bacterium]|nr:apolipoprotein N-acyltransferase [Candidatus Acidoferrales bacterium]